MISPNRAANMATARNIWLSFSTVDMPVTPLEGPCSYEQRGRTPRTVRGASVPSTDCQGQDFSIASRAWVVLLPVIQSVICRQNSVLTAPGIRSEASKRVTAFGSWMISTESLSIGFLKPSGSAFLFALTQPVLSGALMSTHSVDER